MDNASKNASDMIGTLQMQYNRGRQAAITNELVDIITGAFRLLLFVSFYLAILLFSPSRSLPLFSPLLPCFLLPPFAPTLFPLSPSPSMSCMCPSNAHPFQQVPVLFKPRAYVRNKRPVDTTIVATITSCMPLSCQRFIDLTRLLA
jgi:hypothetical protein